MAVPIEDNSGVTPLHKDDPAQDVGERRGEVGLRPLFGLHLLILIFILRVAPGHIVVLVAVVVPLHALKLLPLEGFVFMQDLEQPQDLGGDELEVQ